MVATTFFTHLNQRNSGSSKKSYICFKKHVYRIIFIIQEGTTSPLPPGSKRIVKYIFVKRGNWKKWEEKELNRRKLVVKKIFLLQQPPPPRVVQKEIIQNMHFL